VGGMTHFTIIIQLPPLSVEAEYGHLIVSIKLYSTFRSWT